MTDEASTKPMLDFNELGDTAYVRPGYLHEHQIVPFSTATRCRKSEAGTFPSPIKISTNIIAFRVRDIREWQKDPANYKATTPCDFKLITKKGHKASRGNQK